MEYLTPEQYAKTRPRPVSPITVQRWCRLGLVKYIRDGRRLLIPESEVGREIEFKKEPTPPKLQAAKPLSPKIQDNLDLCEDSIEEAELRDKLPEIVDRTQNAKDRFLVRRNGQPVAILLPLDDLPLLEIGEDTLWAERAAKVDRSGPGIPIEQVAARLGVSLKGSK